MPKQNSKLRKKIVKKNEQDNILPDRVFYTALEATANGVVITDKRGNIAWVNKAFTNLTGYDFIEVVGKNPSILKSGKQSDDLYKDLWTTILKGKIWRGEIVNRRKDGTFYMEDMTISPIFDKDKKISNFIAIKQDITARKKTEEQLEHSNKKISQILNSIQDDFYVLDRNWNFLYASRQFTAKIGKEPKDFVGKNIWKFFPKHKGGILEKNFKATMKDRETRRFEIGGKYTDAWYDMTCFPSPEGITVLGRDISRSKKLENLLETKTKEQEKILDASPAMIFYKDNENHYIWVNRAFARIMGEQKDKLEGKSLFDLYPKKQAELFWQDDKEVIKTGKPKLNIIEKMDTKNGTLWLETNKIPYRDENGNIKGIIGFAIDITQRKKREYVEFQKRMMEQERQKTSFIADATHELRTPIAIIRGNVDLMMREGRNKSNTKKFKAINEEIEHLTELLSDLSLLTSSDTLVHRNVFFENVDLPKIVKKAADRCKTLALKKNISIKLSKMPRIEIQGDRFYLEKLFLNVIKNAITYGKESGWISISVAKNNNNVEILISDNGIGIKSEEIPFVFERFYRTAEAKENNHKGTGLGLSISKWIVESHGGKIEVLNSSAKGTTFAINLPLVS